MKYHRALSLSCMLLSVTLVLGVMAAEKPGADRSEWSIHDIYAYLGAMRDELSKEEIDQYCQFLVASQDPQTGNFVDKHGGVVYSVKAYSLLKSFGYEPKYPLAVCSGTNDAWGQIDGKPVTEHLSPEEFRKWLDQCYRMEDAYSAGSSFGHFITPHVINLKRAGKKLEDSPYIPVFRQWLLEHQNENGFWNRPGDPDFNGWNGVMKMDQALGAAGIQLPRQKQMLETVLKYQDPVDGNFTAAGGCTNHNALHTLRQWSKRNDLLMWREIFVAMERFTESLERRWDPVSGNFRPPPGFDQPPQFRATELAHMATGNVIGYCTILLRPENVGLLKEQQIPQGEDSITVDRIRSLLVRAMGIEALATQKVKEHLAAQREQKYGE